MPENITERTKETAKPKEAPKRESYLKAWFLRYYRVACLGIALAILGAGYFMLLGPKIASINQTIGAQLAEEQAKKEELEKRLNYLAVLARKRERFTGEDIARAADMLPSEPNLPELFTVFEWLGRDSGVQVESISISQAGGGKKSAKGGVDASAGKGLPEGVKPIEVGLSVTAENYNQVKTFLANIERSSRIMDAVALNYSPNGSSYTVTVRVYYQPEKVNADESGSEAGTAGASGDTN